MKFGISRLQLQNIFSWQVFVFLTLYFPYSLTLRYQKCTRMLKLKYLQLRQMRNRMKLIGKYIGHIYHYMHSYFPIQYYRLEMGFNAELCDMSLILLSIQ